jgi:hypothetical protein
MTEPRRALAGWGMLLDESLPRLLAMLALKLGMPPAEALERLSPRDLVLLAEALAADATAPTVVEPCQDLARLQTFLME